MRFPYGYLVGSKGKDGEEVDMYLGPEKKAPVAYVVHQRHANGKGHDEDKVMLGFPHEDAARKAYLAHYNSPKFLGPISAVLVETLKRLLGKKEKLVKITGEEKAAQYLAFVEELGKMGETTHEAQ